MKELKKRVEVKAQPRELTMRIWHVIMWGGLLVFTLSVIALRLPVRVCLASFFLFLGTWIFASDRITKYIANGSGK
jgi:hypothetical protein